MLYRYHIVLIWFWLQWNHYVSYLYKRVCVHAVKFVYYDVIYYDYILL